MVTLEEEYKAWPKEAKELREPPILSTTSQACSTTPCRLAPHTSNTSGTLRRPVTRSLSSFSVSCGMRTAGALRLRPGVDRPTDACCCRTRGNVRSSAEGAGRRQRAGRRGQGQAPRSPRGAAKLKDRLLTPE